VTIVFGKKNIIITHNAQLRVSRKEIRFVSHHSGSDQGG